MSEAQIETKIALLEKELSQISGLFERLDTTIEKLTEVSSTIRQLLAVHETKINQHDQTHRDIYAEIEKRRVDSIAQHNLTQTSITAMEMNFKKELDTLEKSITDELKSLRKDQSDGLEAISKRTQTVEKWRWIITGGILVVSWVVSTLLIPAMLYHQSK